MPTLGDRLARAVAAKDHDAVRAVLAPDVDFRGLTPGRTWEGTGPDAVIDTFFAHWFEDQDEVRGLVAVEENEPVEDTAHVSYRLALRTPDGDHTAEQQAYYRVDQDRISHLRVMCSGFRPTRRAASGEDAPTG